MGDRGQQAGIALPLTLAVAAVLLVVAAWMATVGSQSLNLLQASNQSDASVYAADAALTEVRQQFISNPTFGQPSPTPGSTTSSSAWTTIPASVADQTYAYSAGTQTETMVYSVEVTNNVNGSQTIFGPNGVQVPPGNAYLLATAGLQSGGVADVTRTRYRRHAGEMISITPAGPYQYAIAARGAVTLSGEANTTAINSGGVVTPNGAGVASVNGPFAFAGGPLVHGDVVGPGSSTVDPSFYTGRARGGPSNTSFLNLPQAPPGPGTDDLLYSGQTHANLAPGTYGNLTLRGQSTVTLQGGTYVFNDVSATGQSQILVPSNISSPVALYFYGSFDAAGGNLVNQTSVARDLQVIQAGASAEGRSVTLAGGPQVTAVVDAPDLDVRLVGDSALTGALIGNTVTMVGNGGVIYDESLAHVGAATSTVVVSSYWRD